MRRGPAPNVYAIKELRTHVLSYCRTPQLIKMRVVSKDTLHDVDFILSKRYNVDRVLIHYFTDVSAFRSFMYRYNTFISGNFALQFLREREDIQTIPLDVFVPFECAATLSQFLSTCGYAHSVGVDVGICMGEDAGIRSTRKWTRGVGQDARAVLVNVINPLVDTFDVLVLSHSSKYSFKHIVQHTLNP